MNSAGAYLQPFLLLPHSAGATGLGQHAFETSSSPSLPGTDTGSPVLFLSVIYVSFVPHHGGLGNLWLISVAVWKAAQVCTLFTPSVAQNSWEELRSLAGEKEWALGSHPALTCDNCLPPNPSSVLWIHSKPCVCCGNTLPLSYPLSPSTTLLGLPYVVLAEEKEEQFSVSLQGAGTF